MNEREAAMWTTERGRRGKGEGGKAMTLPKTTIEVPVYEIDGGKEQKP